MTPSIKDTVERLRVYERAWGDEPSIPPHPENSFGLTTGKVIGDMAEAIALIERLAGALEKIADLDVEYPRATVYRDDGQYSKHDKCPHDHWMYEGCESCIADFARRALSGEPTP